MKTLLELCSRPIVSLRGDWWAIPLRLIVGYGFMEHATAKLARGPESFIAILHALHLPAAPLLAWVTIFIELLGGLAVLVGAFVPLVSVPMIIVLLVAIVTVHLPNGFSSIKLESVTRAGAHFGQPGYETDLLISPASSPSCSAATGRSHSMRGWRAAESEMKPLKARGDPTSQSHPDLKPTTHTTEITMSSRNSSRFIAGRAAGALAMTLLASTLALAGEQGDSERSALVLTSTNDPSGNRVAVFQLETGGQPTLSLVQTLATGGKGGASGNAGILQVEGDLGAVA